MRASSCSLLLCLWAASSALASDPNESPAMQAIEDIYAGKPVSIAEGGREPTAPERAEIARLSGCLPSNELHKKALVPVIDWNCSGNPSDSRTTTIYFSGEGLMDILVQPLASRFRPTEIALAATDLPSRGKITRLFLRAIKDGEDPTLSGLIPISEIQLARLGVAKGNSPRRMSGSSRSSQVHMWLDANSELDAPIITDLRFNKEGQPIGVVISHAKKVFRPASIR